MLWVNAVCSNWKVKLVQLNLKPWHFIIRLFKQLVKLTFIHGWLKLVPDTMFQSARWCVETFQLKQLIVFHFQFQVCDPLSRAASVTTVFRSNHLLVPIKWPCNQKGFCRNHQLRKLPTSTFQQKCPEILALCDMVSAGGCWMMMGYYVKWHTSSTYGVLL